MRPLPPLLLTLALLTGCGDDVVALVESRGANLERAQDLYARVRQSDQEAKRELEVLGSGRDAAAAFFAGLANDPALVQGADPMKAVTFYQAAGVFPGAKHNLALLALKGVGLTGQEPLDPIALLSDAATKGRVESMLLLGTLYDEGWPGVERNSALAAQWYERAAEYANEPRAVARLGAAYQDGSGRPVNQAKAETYLLAAAKAGITEAQYRMAFLAQDRTMRAQWLTVAAIGDARYQPAALEALTAFGPQEQEQVKRNALMWRHAHARDQELLRYAAPLRTP